MKKFALIFLLLFGVFAMVSVRGIGATPFFHPMNREHPFQIIWINGEQFNGSGAGWREFYGFPFSALTIDKVSGEMRRARTAEEMQQSPQIDSWRFRIDLFRLIANILFAATLAFVLVKAGERFARRKERRKHRN